MHVTTDNTRFEKHFPNEDLTWDEKEVKYANLRTQTLLEGWMMSQISRLQDECLYYFSSSYGWCLMYTNGYSVAHPYFYTKEKMEEWANLNGLIIIGEDLH